MFKRIILVVTILVIFVLLILGCINTKKISSEEQERINTYPVMVQQISELPQEFDTLITMGNYKFCVPSKYMSSGTGLGGIYLMPNYSYEQVWLDKQEDAIWVLRDDTQTILQGDIIRITTLTR